MGQHLRAKLGPAGRVELARLQLDEQPGALVDLPENLFSDATVRGSPEEPRVPIDAGVEIRYRDTGEEVGDRAHLRGGDIAPKRCGTDQMSDRPPATITVGVALSPASETRRGSEPSVALREQQRWWRSSCAWTVLSVRFAPCQSSSATRRRR
jgi:hypothetical protein